MNGEYSTFPGAADVIKGTAHRIIVVKSPDTRLFTEAVFVVRDDVFREGVSEKELMRQAGEAAKAFTAAAIPAAKRKIPYLLLLPMAALLAAAIYLIFT